MSKNTDTKKRQVIIVGGGIAGASIARSLSASLDPARYNLTLINPRSYYIFRIATLRLVVSERDHMENSAFIPYDKLFHNGNGTFVQGTVKAVHAAERSGKVVLSDGRELPYDVLVLATGSKWTGPIAFPEDPEQVPTFIKGNRAKFQNAKHIIIAGGGAVGIELSGEIKDIWPDKNVTIVQAGSRLLNTTYPDRFRDAAKASVRARGIDVILGDIIENAPDVGVVDGITTRNGIKLEADLVVSARGPGPNTAFISTIGPDALTKNGFVTVQPTLQLKGHPNILAAGDIIDWPEQKQAGKAGKHADIIASNVVAYLERKPLKEYKGTMEMIALTNGRRGGLGYFDVLCGITIGNWLTSFLKSKHLFVSATRTKLGY